MKTKAVIVVSRGVGRVDGREVTIGTRGSEIILSSMQVKPGDIIHLQEYRA